MQPFFKPLAAMLLYTTVKHETKYALVYASAFKAAFEQRQRFRRVHCKTSHYDIF